jgi:tetratricopeptide (TPR) repeat protein
VELVPLDHVAAVHYLRALYHRGKKAAVQEQLERMFDTFEEVVLSLNALLYLGNLGESELGLQLIAEGLRRNPRSASYHQSAGNIHKAMEAWSPALVCYQAAIDCDRQHVNAYLGKARCHLVLDQLAEAEATLRELLQVVADSKEGGRLLAQTLVLGKRPHEAAQIYSRLRQVDPNDFELALAHSRLLPNKEREALLSQVTKKHPQRAEAWQEYLRLLLQMGRQKKIMTAVEAALLHCGEEPAILYLSAFAVQTVRKDSAGALPLLRKALGLFPGHVEAWRLRGRLAQQEGLVEEARECWQKILELRPKDREAHKKLGQEDSDSAQE